MSMLKRVIDKLKTTRRVGSLDHLLVPDNLDTFEDLEQMKAIVRGKDDRIRFLVEEKNQLILELEDLSRAIAAAPEAFATRNEAPESRDPVGELEGSSPDPWEQRRSVLISALTRRLHAISTRLAARERLLERILSYTDSTFGPAGLEQVSEHLDLQKRANRLLQQLDRIREFYTAYLSTTGNARIYQDSQARLDVERGILDQKVAQLVESVRAADTLYQPSDFWWKFFDINMAQLRSVGLSNFKLCVNQNYHNFIPRSLNDPKLRPLLRWFRHNPSLRPLFASMENPDNIAPNSYLGLPGTSLFGNDITRQVLYRTLVVLGWEYVKAHDPFNLCADLEEPELGNPIRVFSDGRLISQDMATSVSEATQILCALKDKQASPPYSFLEIGSGYGRLAQTLMSTQPVARYVIVDIPPAICLSEWYLSSLFPDKKIFASRDFATWDEVAEQADSSDLIFLLPHQIELLPDTYVQTALAVSSLHEMRPDQFNNYLGHMGRLARDLIYSKQYWVYENPYDAITIRCEDYATPRGFVRRSLESDPLNPTFFVDILERQAGAPSDTEASRAG